MRREKTLLHLSIAGRFRLFKKGRNRNRALDYTLDSTIKVIVYFYNTDKQVTWEVLGELSQKDHGGLSLL
jgi:hypothetical protein